MSASCGVRHAFSFSLPPTFAMTPEAHQFLLTLLQTPSPSGYEEAIQHEIGTYLRPHVESLRTDAHGNLHAVRGAKNDRPRLMFAGHCDQIGMLVSYIDEHGFIHAQTIGGWDPQQLIGQAMVIWTEHGPIDALISRKPIHLLTNKEREQVVQLEQMWLDIGARDRKHAEQLVAVGDPVTLRLGARPLQSELICGPGLDNKTGTWVVTEAFRRAATAEGELRCALHSVSTVQEEIGLRGAQTAAEAVGPDVGIAVDVTHASDCPTIEKQQQGEIRLGDGPVLFRGPNVNHGVRRRLIELAEAHQIPYQIAALGRAASNDANALQVSGHGVATGLVAIPNRYMHSAVEVCSLEDIDHAAELLALFALELSDSDDFTPRHQSLATKPPTPGGETRQ